MNRLIELLGPHMERRSFANNAEVERNLQNSGKLLFVSEGRVLVEYYGVSMDSSVGSIKSAKTWLGLEGLEAPNTKNLLTRVVAYGQVTVLTLSISKLHYLLSHELKEQELIIYMLITRNLSELLVEALKSWELQSTRERILLTLSHIKSLAYRFGKPVPDGQLVTVTAITLAKLSGLDPETIRKHFSKLLAAEKLLRVAPTTLIVLDKEKL